ncbi:KH domain-containing protein [soil metagenome]|nr:KH domain-containing protein [Actinomycetota bacterium]
MSVPGEVLEYIARNLVDDPESVRVEEEAGEGSVTLRLSVAPEDMGKVIGRGGRTARAIRAVVRAAATKAGLHSFVEIVE